MHTEAMQILQYCELQRFFRRWNVSRFFHCEEEEKSNKLF